MLQSRATVDAPLWLRFSAEHGDGDDDEENGEADFHEGMMGIWWGDARGKWGELSCCTSLGSGKL